MRLALLLSGLIALAAPIRSGAQAPPEGPRLVRARGNAGKRLAEVERLLAEGKPQPAADGLRKLLAEAGDDLVGADGRQFRTVRAAARGALEKLPAGERRAWRERSDAPAAALFARAAESRDAGALEVVADEYPLSGSARPALQLLGELAFSRGEFRAAETYWTRAGGESAPSAAGVALAALLQGDAARARTLTDRLRAAHPGAAGPLAGRSGVYADTLTRLAAAPPPVPPPVEGGAEWATLGGSATRANHAARPLSRYWPARPTWVLPLGGPGLAPPEGLAPARSLSRHPVAIGPTGFVADANSVVAFDLTTGARLATYSHPGGGGPGEADAPLTAVPSRGLVFARLGPTDVAPPPPTGGGAVLACLRAGRGKLELAYTLECPVAEGVPAAWEAAPAWRDGRIYAAFVREANNRLVTAIACFADSGGAPIWVADVAEAGVGGPPRARPEPVTLAGGRVVYCTHAGFVVALHESSGRPAWAHAYPPAVRPTPEYRALAPAVFEGGRVFAAPTDGDRVLALDAVDGGLVWEAESTQTEQLLGVSGGHLVASVAAPVRGLRGYELATGSTRGPGGWVVHDDPQLGGHGRGLVAGGAAVWPTRAGVFFVRPTDGRPLAARLAGPHGNLAFANGVLLVATPTEVWGYVRDAGMPTFDEPPASRGQAVADRLARLPAGGGAPALAAFRRDAGLTAEGDAEVVQTPTGVPARLGSLAARHFLPGASPVSTPAPGEPAAGDAAVVLGDDVRVNGSVPLPSRGCVPLLPFAGCAGLPGLTPAGGRRAILIVADAAAVHALAPNEAKPLWSRATPAGLQFTQAAAEGDRVTLAGPRGLASLERDTGRVEWLYRHPDALPDLSEPQLAWPLLTARVGVASRLCVEAATGEIVWGRDGTGAARLAADAPAGEPFASPLTPSAGGWVGQVAPGQCVVIDRDTGATRAESPTYPNPWPGAAARLDRGGVAVADGPGRVRVVETDVTTDSTRPAWAWEAGGAASLAGRMPHLARGVAGLYVAVERNHATELVLLTPRGEPVWPRGARLPPGVPDLTTLAEDRERAYVVNGDGLHAVRLVDGVVEWSADLPALLGVPPGSRATVDAGARGVVVAAAAPGDDAPSLGDVFAGLIANRFVSTAVAQLDAASTAGVTVAVLDPATGVRRGGVRVAGGVAAWRLAGAQPVVVTPGVAHWLR